MNFLCSRFSTLIDSGNGAAGMNTISTGFSKVLYFVRQRNWLDRALAGIGLIALFLLAIFFFAVFLLVGGALALLIYARWCWLTRRSVEKDRTLEGDYVVIEEAREHSCTDKRLQREPADPTR
jgi:hypothetical protein